MLKLRSFKVILYELKKKSHHSAGFLEIINYFIHVLATVPIIYSEIIVFLFLFLFWIKMSDQLLVGNLHFEYCFLIL